MELVEADRKDSGAVRGRTYFTCPGDVGCSCRLN